MIQRRRYELIEDYISNNLNEESKRVFEELLNNDPDFVKELRLVEDIRNTIANVPEMEFEENLSIVQREFFSGEKTNKPRKILNSGTIAWWKWAAGILLFMSATMVFLLNRSPKNTDRGDVFAQYCEPYPAYGLLRADAVSDSILMKAVTYYHKKEFGRALDFFQQSLSNDENTDILSIFYAGICHLYLDQEEEALGAFQKVVKQNNNLFVEQSKWYMAMCYIKFGDEEKAKTILKELKGTSQERKAEELLQSLDR